MNAPHSTLAHHSHAEWDRLIQAIGPASLLVVIGSRLGSALRAKLAPEDILQEALLHAWRDRSRFEWRGLGSFRTWLLTIIDNRIHAAAASFSTQKRGGQARTISINAMLSEDAGASASAQWAEPPVSTTPSRIAIYKEQAASMEQALASLPHELQAIIRFRLFEQLPLDEVASRLSLGVEAVRHKLRKGSELYRSRLATILQSRPRPSVRENHDDGSSKSDDSYADPSP